jgi:hypothetical protein
MQKLKFFRPAPQLICKENTPCYIINETIVLGRKNQDMGNIPAS